MATVVYTKLKKNELRNIVREFPRMFSGKSPDRAGIVHGFKMRLGWAFCTSIVEAFIQKGRGGTDEAGESWKKLTPQYLAYSRPMETAKGRGSRNPPKAGKQAPGGRENRTNDGFLNDKQMKRWRQIFARTLARLRMTMPTDEAKSFAAALAWNQLKREGAKTKLSVFGSRTVQIGVDRGILLGSISPGVITNNEADADFKFEEDAGYTEDNPGELVVGTRVPYAKGFHAIRPLWPKPERWPQAWWDDWLEVAVSGIKRAASLIARGG